MCKLKAKSHSYKQRGHTQIKKTNSYSPLGNSNRQSTRTAWPVGDLVHSILLSLSLSLCLPLLLSLFVFVFVFVTVFHFVFVIVSDLVQRILPSSTTTSASKGHHDPGPSYSTGGSFFPQKLFSTIELIDSELTNCSSRFLCKKKN